MDLNYNFLSLIEALGLIQGIILGVLLLIINRNKQKSTFFLGLFILVFCLHYMPIIIDDTNLTEYYPKLELLPLNTIWMGYSLLFIYVQKISVFSRKKIAYKLLYPGIIAFLAQTIIFLLPVETKLYIKDSVYLNLFFLLGMLYSLGIAMYTLRFINRHAKEVKNQYSSTEYKQLYWIALFIIFSFVPILMMLWSHFLEPSYNLRLITACISVVLLYWVSIRGIMQANILPIIAKSSPLKTQTSSIPYTVLQEVVNKASNYIVSSEAYKNKELTIVDISENLNIHPRRISTAINKIRKQNFNSYINEFRINKAKKLILNQKMDNLSIDGIGDEVGFHSKSVFYYAFKNNTGTTPSRYKETN